MKKYRAIKPFTEQELIKQKNEFIRQSLSVAKGKTGSLAWFNSYLKPWQNKLIVDRPVLVMDFGGSYFRIGVAESSDGEKIHWRKPLSLTKIVREYPNKEAFINWLVDKSAPLIKKYSADRVGFIFSQAFDSKKNGDEHITGVVTYLSKALVIPGLVGRDLGKLYLRALRLRGLHLKKMVMLNDTIAVALCANKATIGLVIGTGANIGSIHPRLPYLRNLEAGHFNAVPHSQASIYADLIENPGKATMEKQSTGLYQYQNLAFACVQADLPIEVAQIIMNCGKESASLIVSQLAKNNFALLKIKLNPGEKKKIVFLAKTILINAYQMWGAAVAAIIELNKAKLSDKEIQIPVTGGVILNDKNFYQGLKETIEKLSKRKIQLIKVEDSIKGAAVAALME